ncbi:MAG: hypothetical protein ACRDBY_11100 [Cetobacterium sp.]
MFEDIYNIIEKKNEKINFMHITMAENVQSILDNGFRPSDEYFITYKGELHKVLYVVDLDSYIGIEALSEWAIDIEELGANDDFAIIIGTYDGEYLECVNVIDEDDSINCEFIGYIGLKEMDKIKILKHEYCKGKDIQNLIYKVNL